MEDEGQVNHCCLANAEGSGLDTREDEQKKLSG